MTKVSSYYAHQIRPRSITIIIWGLFLLGLANGWRAIGLNRQGGLLLALDSSLNPGVGLAFALIWSILFIIAAVTLWQRRTWTRFLIPGLLLTHGIYQLALVLIFARSAASRNAWLAIGLLFTLALLFSVWALHRPSVRWYFENL
jgi:hypothetical protein